MSALVELLEAEAESANPRMLYVHDRSDRRHIFHSHEWIVQDGVLMRLKGGAGLTDFWLPIANINHITLVPENI